MNTWKNNLISAAQTIIDNADLICDKMVDNYEDASIWIYFEEGGKVRVSMDKDWVFGK